MSCIRTGSPARKPSLSVRNRALFADNGEFAPRCALARTEKARVARLIIADLFGIGGIHREPVQIVDLDLEQIGPGTEATHDLLDRDVLGSALEKLAITQAGERQEFAKSAYLSTIGDHFIRVQSDSSADYLLKIDVINK